MQRTMKSTLTSGTGGRSLIEKVQSIDWTTTIIGTLWCATIYWGMFEAAEVTAAVLLTTGALIFQTLPERG